MLIGSTLSNDGFCLDGSSPGTSGAKSSTAAYSASTFTPTVIAPITCPVAGSMIDMETCDWKVWVDSSISTSSTKMASAPARSEEHPSELQSLMRIPYAGFCLKTKNKNQKLQNS